MLFRGFPTTAALLATTVLLLVQGYIASATLDPVDIGIAVALLAVVACQVATLCRGGALVVVAHVLAAAALGVVAVHGETALTWTALVSGSSGDVPGPRFAAQSSALALGCALLVLSVLGVVGALRS
ncbi:hypothetical protein [Allosalinactinospora lopnorensis]|uniref:hypothetical protein n=1 Tax=Allosalinactinospora lopnorensis TaxID=1352348 RepID=UPI000623D633|nr:hypothetical protein [Allosalinactinospora lopnorensis]